MIAILKPFPSQQHPCQHHCQHHCQHLHYRHQKQAGAGRLARSKLNNISHIILNHIHPSLDCSPRFSSQITRKKQMTISMRSIHPHAFLIAWFSLHQPHLRGSSGFQHSMPRYAIYESLHDGLMNKLVGNYVNKPSATPSAPASGRLDIYRDTG